MKKEKVKITTYIVHATNTFKELLLLYAGVLIAGGISFSFFEHKSLYDSIWWSIVTALTVGYGDLYPITLGGRITAVLLMHVVPFFIAPLIIGRILTRMIKDEDKFTHEEQEEVKGELKELVAWVRERKKEHQMKGGK